MRLTKYFLALLISVVFAGISSADISYVESVNGDLTAPDTPTDLGIVDLGKNTVSGTLTNAGVGTDQDAFSFTVDAGQQLDMVSFIAMTDSPADHFLAFNNAALSTGAPGGNQITTLVNSSHIGLNFLDDTLPNTYGGSTVGGGPQAAGTYYVWFQETDGINYDYSFSISTSNVVPEPGSAALVLILGTCVLANRKRKTS